MKMVKLLGLLLLALVRLVLGFGQWNGNGTEVESGLNVWNAPRPLRVALTLIPSAVAKGAVCLDGTPPAYHLHRGHGTGANSWLIQLEGGGWCNDIATCLYRKNTHRGSSNYMERVIEFTGILSNKPEENPGFPQTESLFSLQWMLIFSRCIGVNLYPFFFFFCSWQFWFNFPDFYNWNRVKIRYCDGASFSGESYDKAAGLYFRGQRIFSAAMEELMSKGMRYASHALLSGCSAGGVASIIHCDEFRELLPRRTTVKCLADAGLFLDVADVAGGRSLRSFFGGVVNLQGVGRNLPAACTNRMDATSCFFPQNLLPHIYTPTFVLNAAYDVWQLQESLAPRRADPQGYWQQCKLNHVNCNAGQIRFLQGFRNQMLNAIKRFSLSRQNGLFINSCFAHCQSERQDTWFGNNSPQLANKGIAISVGDWYFDRCGVKAIDCAYPCDKTCHHLVFSRTHYNSSFLPNLNF